MQTEYPIFAIDIYSDAGFEHGQQSKLATVNTYDELWNAISVSVKGEKTISKAINVDSSEVIDVPASMSVKLHRYNCISTLDYSQNSDGTFNQILTIFTEPLLADKMLEKINSIE